MTEYKTEREKTVLEEIANLTIDSSVRNRIMMKAERLEEEYASLRKDYRNLEEKLRNVHLRNEMLENVIIELSIKRYGFKG